MFSHLDNAKRGFNSPQPLTHTTGTTMAYYNTRASAKSSESAPGCIGAIYLGKIYTCALADITDRLTPLAVWTAICKTYKLQYKDHETAGFGYFLNPPLGLPPNIAVMQGKSDSRSAIQFPNSFADIVAGRLATAERKNVFRIGSLDEEDQSWNWDLARDGPLQKTQHGFIHLIFHKKVRAGSILSPQSCAKLFNLVI